MSSDTSTNALTSSKPSTTRRPIGITILAIIYFLAALLSILTIMVGLQNATSRPAERIDIMLPGLVILFLFTGIVCVILGVGLWRLSPIAYWFALIFLICGFVGTVGQFSLTNMQSLIFPLFSLAYALFLCTRSVRAAFGIEKHPTNKRGQVSE